MSRRIERSQSMKRAADLRRPRSFAPVVIITALLVVLVATALTMSCSDGVDDGAALVGTPTSEPAEGTPTTAPFVSPEEPTPWPTDVGPGRQSVRFVPEPLPEPVVNPMEPRFSGGRWQLLVGTPVGEPKVVLDTQDVVGMPEWSPDGRALLIRTFSYEKGFGNHLVYHPDSSEAPQLVAEGTWDAVWSNSGSEVALEVVDKDFKTVAIWLVSPDGTEARRLEGLGNYVTLRGWVPDDSGLLVAKTTYSTGYGVTTLWLIPTDEGDAVQVGNQPVQYPSYAHLEGLWSPDGRRLVYLTGGDVYLFDRLSGESHRLTSTGDYSGTVRWLPTPRFIQVGARFIDPETGSITTIPGVPAYQQAALSPDGRYLAVSEEPSYEGNLVRAGTFLFDVESGVARRLTNPQKGVDVWWWWTPDGQHLLVRRAIGEGGEGIYQIVLVDVATGREKELTAGFEHAANFVVSPDGARLLITGKRLRIASIDGTILREILPPEGLEAGWAKWSPDGSRFFYVTAPSGTTGH